MIPRRLRVVVVLLAVAWAVVGAGAAGCAGDGGPASSREGRRGRALRGGEARAAADTTAADSSGPGSGTADGRPVVLFLGTSLTAGLGVEPSQAYPARIQTLLDSAGFRWRAVNGGVSGETSAGARRRAAWMLGPDVRILVLETGANDGLRGLDVDSTRVNIEAIVRGARDLGSGVRVVLAGMEAPPNLGALYTSRFRAVYRDLARRERLPLIPFILDGVGGVDSLNQEDGIHPTPAGHDVIARTVWRVLEPVLRSAPR